MIFRRRQKQQPGRRQRFAEQEETKLPSAYNYSGNAARQPEAAPANKEKLASFWLARAGLLIFLVAASAAAVNVLSLESSVKILPMSNSDTSFLRPDSAYATSANQYLGSSPMNRTKLTLDSSGLSQHLLKQFPELTNVSVTIPLAAHQPLVYLQAAQPVLILSTSNGSFVIDDAGKALVKITASTQLAQSLPVLTDQSGLSVKLNQQVLPSSDIRFIQIVLAELAAKQYKPDSMTLPGATNELDIRLASLPYFVKFNLQGSDPREQAGTFLATIASLKNQNVTPGQYVDVRVPGRAYYK